MRESAKIIRMAGSDSPYYTFPSTHQERSSASPWKPDLARRNVHSPAWIAAGMAAALAEAAMVFY